MLHSRWLFQEDVKCQTAYHMDQLHESNHSMQPVIRSVNLRIMFSTQKLSLCLQSEMNESHLTVSQF